MAPVIEPTAAHLEGINTLADVARWAKLDGPVDHPGSMAGALFEVLGTPPCMTPEEIAGGVSTHDSWQALLSFANIDPADFGEALRDWKYADFSKQEERDGPTLGDEYVPTLTVKPKPAEKGFARAAYNAARIRAGLVTSREEQKHVSDQKVALEETAVAVQKAVADAAASERLNATKGKVKLAEVVDVTLEGEIPLIPDSEYDTIWSRFRQVTNRPPEPDESPSHQQLTGLQHLITATSCYVDFAQWCAFHFRNLKGFKYAGLVQGPPDASGNQTAMRQESKGPPD